jgi:hypothetical protein
MQGSYFAGAYWLARHETAAACARRAELFFRLLGGCDPAWTGWHDTAGAKVVNTDEATFTRMFGKKEYRRGPDGFRLMFWTGATVLEATSVGVSCGSATPWVPSSCVLSPPDKGPVAERVLTASVMSSVLRAMAQAWEPEWAIATSYEHLEVADGYPPPNAYVGWLMYFSRQRGTVPPLPAPVRVESVEDRGTLVILTPERFTASNPEHVALAARVHALLGPAGLLRSEQPAGS